MEEKVVIGDFQTDAGGIFSAERRAFIGELVLAVFAAEGGHDITAPPAEQTAGHTQFAAGEGALGLAGEDGGKGVNDGGGIRVGFVGDDSAVLHFEGVTEGIIRVGIGALEGFEEEALADVGVGFIFAIHAVVEAGCFPSPRVAEFAAHAAGEADDIGRGGDFFDAEIG